MKIKITFIIKPLLIIILYLLTISLVQGQHLTVEPYYEKNIFGNQYGGILSWEFKQSLQIGGFYQLSLSESGENKVNNEFTGIYFKVPLYRVERLSLSASLKGGIANKRFAIIVPGLETAFHVVKQFSIASVVSLRAGAPALEVKAIFRLF